MTFEQIRALLLDLLIVGGGVAVILGAAFGQVNNPETFVSGAVTCIIAYLWFFRE